MNDLPRILKRPTAPLLLALALALLAAAPARAELSGIASFSSGSDHTCAVTAAGGLKCWGRNVDGQLGDGASGGSNWGRWIPVTPQGLASGVAAVAAGGRHTCALTTAGTVKCWGYNFYGQLGDGTTDSSAVPVDVPGLVGVTAIAAGGSHTCALTAGGAMKCWGDGLYGQLGHGLTTRSLTPADVTGLGSGVASISAGSLHTCAVTTGGAALCWGSNGSGRLGDGSTTHRATPAAVTGLQAGVAHVAAGDTHTCAVTTSGAAKCWGANRYNQAGDGADTTITANWSRTTPVDVVGLASGVAGIAAGSRHSCARLSGGTVKCWGASDFYGAVGTGTLYQPDGSWTRHPTPADVTGLAGVAAMDAGTGHTCTLVAGGKLRCWGNNNDGQLGGGLARGPQPAPTVGVPDYRVASSTSHNLLVNSKGEVWAWGDNTTGKLGNGNTTGTTIPVRVTGLTGVVDAAAGMSHSIALKSDGTVWTWGLNADGQLGIGASSPASCVIPGQFGPNPDDTFPCALTPVQVPGLADVVAVAAGWRHSMALKKDGTVWTWGNDNTGSVGPTAGTNTPVQATGIAFAVRIAAGYMHSVALESNGKVFAWGRAELGELGSGQSVSTSNPVDLSNSDLLYATDIAAGGGFTLARVGTGLRSWGSNVYGALGYDTTALSCTAGPNACEQPRTVPGMPFVSQMATGFGYAIVRKQDGTVWSWGLNNRGQLGTASSPDLCGSSSNRPCARAPLAVPAHDAALLLVAGGAHALAIRPDDTIVAFGDNLVGQLGNRGGNYGTATFNQAIYDPDFTRTPGGTFGTPTGIGTSSSTGTLNASSIADGLYFGALGLGASSALLPVTLSNLSTTDAITFTSIAASGDAIGAEFSVGSSDCPAVLAAAASCNIGLVFSPTVAGMRVGTLTLVSDAANSTSLSFALSGVGVDSRTPSTVALVSSASSSAAGSSVTFTATVNAGGSAIAGTVAFRDGGTPIAGCTAVPVAGSAAACATSALSVGGHSITADYGGSASVQPSSSAPLAHTVFVPFALTVSKAGTGSGTVTSVPAGIDCGGDCTEGYAAGTTVTLTATASASSAFAGWSGACSGTGSCVVLMDAAKGVTATFALQSSRGDVNGDGKGDLFWREASGQGLSWWTMNGAATAGANFFLVPTEWQIADVGDLDGDGKADLIWRRASDGATYLWTLDGLGIKGFADLGILNPAQWSLVGASDLNGDGRDDIVWRNVTDGTVYVWLMNGGAIIGQGPPGAAGLEWQIVDLADLDGDGKSDVVWRRTTDGLVYFWFMNGTAVASETAIGAVDPAAWTLVAGADFDGDGKADLLWRNSAGEAYLWFMNGSVLVSGAFIGNPGLAWTIRTVADLDGDGRADILWRHSDGTMYLWRMNGATLVGAEPVANPGGDWQVVAP